MHRHGAVQEAPRSIAAEPVTSMESHREASHGPLEFYGKKQSLLGRLTGRRAATSQQAPTFSEILQKLRVEESPHPLDEQVEVAGETHHIKDIRRLYRECGMPMTSKGSTIEDLQCTLIPERWNEHDPNAVAVLIHGHHVGYLPAELARDYSPPLLARAAEGLLISGVARVWAKEDAGVARARVTICIPEADVL
jgi:hypothetical protein